jgi:hypothetical protein
MMGMLTSMMIPEVASASLDERGPVLLTPPALLEEARTQSQKGSEVARESWRRTLARADEALSREFTPYQGAEYLRYYRTGRDQAQFIRDLAIVYRVTGDERYGRRAGELLLGWADEFLRVTDFPRQYPAVEIPHASGLVIGRTVLIFADAYAILWADLNANERERVEQWFRGLVAPIKESLRLWEVGEYQGMKPPYFNRQYFNNHLGACVMGIAAIGFAVRDENLIAYATQRRPEAFERPWGEVEHLNRRDLATLIEGVIFMPGDFGSQEEGDVWHRDPSLRGAPPPLPGETFDRYRVVEGKGLHYALLHLRLLTLMAEMTYNNLGTSHYRGGDFYKFVGSRGENLRVSYDLYAEWYLTMDPAAVNDGYYVNSVSAGRAPVAVEQNLDMLALYELAARRYPASERIRRALLARQEAGERVSYDQETFAWTAPFLYGVGSRGP